MSDGIQNLGSLQWQLTLCLLVCWIIVFLVLVKGVQILGIFKSFFMLKNNFLMLQNSPGKVSYFTATFPYLMMTILVVQGALLDGSGKGVSYYLLGESGKFDFSAMFNIELWKDAVGDIFLFRFFI